MRIRVFRQERHHSYLCQEYKLAKWAEKPTAKLLGYFETIDGFRSLIEKQFRVEPQDGELVLWLQGAIENDQTFHSYLDKRHGDAQLGDAAFREELKRAAAGMIIGQYHEACEAGRWPVG